MHVMRCYWRSAILTSVWVRAAARGLSPRTEAVLARHVASHSAGTHRCTAVAPTRTKRALGRVMAFRGTRYPALSGHAAHVFGQRPRPRALAAAVILAAPAADPARSGRPRTRSAACRAAASVLCARQVGEQMNGAWSAPGSRSDRCLGPSMAQSALTTVPSSLPKPFIDDRPADRRVRSDRYRPRTRLRSGRRPIAARRPTRLRLTAGPAAAEQGGQVALERSGRRRASRRFRAVITESESSKEVIRRDGLGTADLVLTAGKTRVECAVPYSRGEHLSVVTSHRK